MSRDLNFSAHTCFFKLRELLFAAKNPMTKFTMLFISYRMNKKEYEFLDEVLCFCINRKLISWHGGHWYYVKASQDVWEYAEAQLQLEGERHLQKLAMEEKYPETLKPVVEQVNSDITPMLMSILSKLDEQNHMFNEQARSLGVLIRVAQIPSQIINDEFNFQPHLSC